MTFLGPVTTLDGRQVRPHDIEILPASVPGALRATVGRLQRVGFEGRAEMVTPGDADTWVQLTRGQAESLGLREGAEVWLSPPRPAPGWPCRHKASAAGTRSTVCEDESVQISAKSDYAVRALLSLAAREPDLVKIDALVTDQGLPRKFVEAILGELRRAGLVRSQRGADGGYALSRPAADITLGAVIRAVDGPLAEVRGLRPHETEYVGVAEHLPQVWVAVRSALRSVLDEVTLAQVLAGDLPANVRALIDAPDAWQSR